MSADPGSPGPTLGRDEVAHLARLARLELTDDELDLFARPARRDPRARSRRSARSPPTTSRRPRTPCRWTNVFRPDELRPGLTQEEALSGAPAAEDGRFRVPRILGEEQ